MIPFIFSLLLLFSNNCLFAGQNDEITIITGNDQSLAGVVRDDKIAHIDKEYTSEFVIVPFPKSGSILKIDIKEFKKTVIEKHYKNQSFLEKHSNFIALGTGLAMGAGLVLYLQNRDAFSLIHEERVR